MSDDLETRLRRLEDLEAIRGLIAAYGPAVDSGDAAAAAALWMEGGTYEFSAPTESDASATVALHGPDGIARMVDGPAHQSIIGGGSAHFLGPVRIDLAGDRAVAVGYSLLIQAGMSRTSFSRRRESARQ